MKTYKKLLILGLVVVAFIVFISNNAKAANFSQTSVSLSVGQTSVITAYNVSSFLYLSSNSSGNVASITISGNNVNIYGLSNGSTTALICENNSTSCTSLYITVSGNNTNGNLTLSQTSLSLTVGQTSMVTASNNYGTLYISSNSNQNVATSYMNSNNNISIYGSSVGSTTIVVCQNSNTSYCGTIYVNVVGGYVSNYNPVTTGLSVSSLILSVGSAATITSPNSAGVIVSTNVNPKVASTSYSPLISGCTAGASFSITTGQSCYGSNNNNYNNNYSSNIPGCYSGAQYSITTGQSCSNNQTYNNGTGAVEIVALAVGTDTITFCQNNNASMCSSVYITVY